MAKKMSGRDLALDATPTEPPGSPAARRAPPRRQNKYYKLVAKIGKVAERTIRHSSLPERADDLSQAVELRALEQLAKDLTYFERHPWKAWAIAVARNEALNAWKREERATQRELAYGRQWEEDAGPTLDADARVLRHELQDALKRAINSLDPDRRQLFIEHVVNGRSTEELAEMTGKTPNTIKQYLYETRRDLRPFLFDWAPWTAARVSEAKAMYLGMKSKTSGQDESTAARNQT